MHGHMNIKLETNCREVCALWVRIVVRYNIKMFVLFSEVFSPSVGSNTMSPNWFNVESLPTARVGANMTRFTPVYKAKQSLYRPGQILWVPGGWGSRISRHSSREGGKVVSPTHRQSWPARKYWYSFLLDWFDSMEGLCQWKSLMIPLGMEPAIFLLVAQYLNQLRSTMLYSTF
jgi:hypothetical protein